VAVVFRIAAAVFRIAAAAYVAAGGPQGRDVEPKCRAEMRISLGR
jgi:hypothetical protein